MERSSRVAIGLLVIVGLMLLPSCATAPEESTAAGAATVEKIPAAAAASGSENLSVELAEEAARSKEEAMIATEAKKSVQQPVVEQEPAKSAAVPARQMDTTPLVIEKIVTAETAASAAPV